MLFNLRTIILIVQLLKPCLAPEVPDPILATDKDEIEQAKGALLKSEKARKFIHAGPLSEDQAVLKEAKDASGYRSCGGRVPGLGFAERNPSNENAGQLENNILKVEESHAPENVVKECFKKRLIKLGEILSGRAFLLTLFTPVWIVWVKLGFELYAGLDKPRSELQGVARNAAKLAMFVGFGILAYIPAKAIKNFVRDGRADCESARLGQARKSKED